MESASELLERAFDVESARYDRKYASSWAMASLRRRFRKAAAGAFEPCTRLLEVGAGTGEETLHFAGKGWRVTATDPSPAMLRALERKAAAAGLRIEARLGSTRGLPADPVPYAGAYAFWGPLNYDRDLRGFSRQLGAMLAPGAPFVFTSVNRACLWEAASALARLDPRTAFRRLSADGVEVEVGERTLRAYCPDWGALTSQFAAEFEPVRCLGLGVFVPPPYLEGRIPEEPWGHALEALEDEFGGLWPLSRLGDHMIVVLRRKR